MMRGPDGKDLSRASLTANFDYWLGQLSGRAALDPDSPPTESSEFLRTIPTTHTWGSLGHAIDRYDLFLYEKILFIDNALLSKNERRRRKNKVSGTVGKTAREYGLEDYVFAFLGGHEPYYARPEFPAFGVFIRKSPALETYPECNATRRDLGSDEVKGREEPISKHFLLPEHGRLLAEAEIMNDPRHARNPWHYWGAVPHWSEDTWQRKVEYHFHGRVELRDFAAILWPRDDPVLVEGEARTSVSKLTTRIAEFKQKVPDCEVITYQSDPGDHAMTFVKASSIAAQFFVRNGRFPKYIGPRGESF